MNRRRFVIRNLSRSNIQILVEAHARGVLHSDTVSPLLLTALIKINAAASDEGRTESNQLFTVPRQLAISSRYVKPICGAFAPISTTHGLIALVCISTLGLITGACQPLYPTSITRWLETTSGTDIFLASMIFLACILFHELGHGTTCLNRTGLIGRVTGRLYMGIPILTTDVSSLHFASNRDKAAVAMSGIIFQTAGSVALLLFPSEIVRTGATLSLMSAAFSLMPLPGSDGYWFLTDLFEAKIVGYFGSKGRRDWVGATYTLFLISVTPYFVYKLTNIGFLQFNRLANNIHHEGNISLILLIGIYAWIVAFLFAKKVIKFLKDGRPEIN